MRQERGQALIFFTLAMPLVLAVALVVVDGSRGFVERRAVQNAADAAALAAARDLQPALSTCDSACMAGVRSNVESTLADYIARNGVTPTASPLPQCSQPSDKTCYTWPYNGSNGKVEVRLQTNPGGFFNRVAGFATDFLRPSARSVAAAAGITETHCYMNGVQRDDLLPSCVLPGQPGTGTFAYTASTACDSITITHGSEDFSGGGLWSNGGVSTSGSPNTAAYVKTASGSCAYNQSDWQDASGNPLPRTSVASRADGAGVGAVTAQSDSTHLTVDNVAGFAAGQTVYLSPGATTATISAVDTTTNVITFSASVGTQALGTVVTNIDFPLPLPSVTPWPCTAGNVTVNSSWLSAHPAGTYCFTGVITLSASFTGYTFISTFGNGLGDQAIKCTANGLSFIAPGSDPKNNLLLYAVHGDVIMTPGSGVITKGMIYAPQGQVKYTGATNTEEGFLMTQKLTINNGPTTFVGSGPGGNGTPDQPGNIVTTVTGSNVSIAE